MIVTSRSCSIKFIPWRYVTQNTSEDTKTPVPRDLRLKHLVVILQILISNLVCRISRLTRNFKDTRINSPWRNIFVISLFTLALLYSRNCGEVTETRHSLVSLNSRRMLVVFHPLETDTLAYPFLKRFLFSLEVHPSLISHSRFHTV